MHVHLQKIYQFFRPDKFIDVFPEVPSNPAQAHRLIQLYNSRLIGVNTSKEEVYASAEKICLHPHTVNRIQPESKLPTGYFHNFLAY